MIALEFFENLKSICAGFDAHYDVMDCEGLRYVSVQRYPMLIVANTSRAPNPGHWCSFFMKDESSPIEFFDTFNLPPDVHNEDFLPFMRRMSDQMLTMPRAIQCQDSNYCGHHCLNYLSARLNQKTIEYIYTYIFSPGCRSNDLESKNFVKSITASRRVKKCKRRQK